MDYRVVVIYETKANQLEKVRIEVCLATKSRNLSPFQRRITLQDLWNIDNISNKKFSNCWIRQDRIISHSPLKEGFFLFSKCDKHFEIVVPLIFRMVEKEV